MAKASGDFTGGNANTDTLDNPKVLNPKGLLLVTWFLPREYSCEEHIKDESWLPAQAPLIVLI
jgi:hypothetical protein